MAYWLWYYTKMSEKIFSVKEDLIDLAFSSFKNSPKFAIAVIKSYVRSKFWYWKPSGPFLSGFIDFFGKHDEAIDKFIGPRND